MKDFIESAKRYLQTENITTPKFEVFTESGKIANFDTHKDGDTLYAVYKMDDGKAVAFWGDSHFFLHGEKVYILSEHEYMKEPAHLFVTIPQENGKPEYSAKLVYYGAKYII